ncbi:MAG: tetratricopeptide repeat protein [Caldilineaceae bacterium]|nr:tetratricopeptide repeat protein [Caldilineaceae bacterium]
MTDFFISYNQADRTWAEWIGWQLEAKGYAVTLQVWDFRPGGNFVLDMQRAAADSARTIAVLSPDYVAARFTQPEWAAAFAQDPTGEQGKLLPIRVREVRLDGLLAPIVYVDLVGRDEAAALTALLAGVERSRAKPSAPPLFPGAGLAPLAAAPRFPAALPPVWNVPAHHRRNPNFTGRAAVLAELYAALNNGPPAARVQAVCGLGGLGKTQLVVEYLHRHSADYEVVWWLRAEGGATLAGDYAALAGPLGLPEAQQPEEPPAIDAVRRWLSQNGKWLLLFDNAPGPDAVRPYLPHGPGHVLITARDPNWRADAAVVHLPLWTQEEAAAFLHRRSGHHNDPAAGDLAAALGYLPLALEQAAAYSEQTGLPLAAYLALWRTRRADLWQDEQPPPGYPDTVASTWSLSMEEAERAAPGAGDLLRLCAYLGPDAIPRPLLAAGAAHLPPALAAIVADPLALNRAIAALRRYSLLETGGDALSVHRLVQLVVRDRIDPADQPLWAAAALRLVNEAFPHESDDVRTWPVCAELLPHAAAAAEHALAFPVEEEACTRLLNQMGTYAWSRAAYREAKELFERALGIDEAAFGPDHPSVATDVNNLGGVLQALGDLAAARDAYERALRIDEAAFGPDHPTVAIRVNNLGSVLQDLGDLAAARQAFEQALRIGEAAFGPDHPTVAIRVNNLGGVLYALGDPAAARDAFERALRIDEVAFGPDHPTVATDVNNLGMVLKALGDLAAARDAYERALGIDEAAFGPDHPTVATDVNNLGLVLYALGDLAAARQAIERALRIDEAAFGPDHPNVAIRVNNLGLVLYALGNLAGARDAFERALAILRHFLGDEHPNTRTARGNLDALG